MKWYWTPKGWVLAVIAIGLLAGAAFVKNEIISSIMIILGLVIMATGYIRTYLNIKRKNKTNVGSK